jgi:outer membrane protein assembly factor BamB
MVMCTPAWGALADGKPRFGLLPVGWRWSLTLDADLAGPPGFLDSYAVLAFDTGQLIAYDLQQGHQLWSVERRASTAPVLAEGRVYVVHERRLFALDLADGRSLWDVELPQPLSAPAVAVGGWVFTVDEAAQVTAYRRDDGARIWAVEAGAVSEQPVAVEGAHVYVARRDGVIVSLRVENGSRVWDRRIGGAPQPMLALRDRIYVGGDDNYVYCLMAGDGRFDWRWRTGGDIVGAPVLDGDRIYVVSMDALVRALDRRSGSQRWKQPLPWRPTRGLVSAPETVLATGVGQTASFIQGMAIKDGASPGPLDADGLLAGPLHVAPAPSLPSSLMVFVARSLKLGTTITAYTRSLEPAFTPIQPLPDPNAAKPTPGSASPRVVPPTQGEPPQGLPPVGAPPMPVGEPPAGLPPAGSAGVR